MEKREAAIRAHEPPPKLVVEIVRPSTATDDYRTKRTEYAVLDILEYWIVDPLKSRVTVCSLQDGAYDDQVFQSDELIVFTTFSTLKLTTQQILSA